MLRTKMPLWFSYWRVQKAFPELSGSFAVGCTDFMCPKNDSADSDASKEAGGIFVRFFYPTAKTAETQDEANHCRWVPRREYTTGMVNFMQLPTWLLGRLFYWTVGSVRMPAVYNAPILKPVCGSPERESLPCIVFSHGLGGNRLVYSHFCCDLASRGCLVAAIEHRDQSASATFVLHVNNNDSKVTEEWIRYRKLKPTDDEFRLRNSQVHKRSDECIHAHNLLEMIHAGNFPPNLFNDTSVLQELKGRLDLSRVAMVGHSFGGATTVLSLAKDKRFRCGVALDVWMLPLGEDIYNYEVEQPLLFINTQAFHRWPENHEPLKTFINKKPDTRPIIAIRWTKHMNQCDIPAVLPPYILRVTALGGKLSPTISLSLNCQAIWAHVSRHLGLRFLDLENEDPGQTFGTLAEIKDIGNPPQRIPIIDGGEGTPKLVIIGQDFIPATEDLREMMAAGDFSRDALKGSL